MAGQTLYACITRVVITSLGSYQLHMQVEEESPSMHGGPNSLRVYYESGYYLFGFISTPYASRRGISQYAWRAELFTGVLRRVVITSLGSYQLHMQSSRRIPQHAWRAELFTRVLREWLLHLWVHINSICKVVKESPSMHGGPNSLRVYYESGYYLFGFISTSYASSRGISQHAWRAKLLTRVLREWLLPLWVHINSICKVVEESPSMHGGLNSLRVYYESGYYLFGFISTPYAK